MRSTLGQNVKSARMPKPTGFGLGSRVRPSCAAKMTMRSGPVPTQRSTNPIQKKRDMRLSGAACAISLMKNSTSNEKELSHRWRKRALLRSLISKSSKSYSSERPAVGWSDWLGLLTNVYSQFVEQQFQLFQR